VVDEPGVFVDTNVLVYARDASEPDKQPRARAWMDALWRARAGRISVQVIEEYYVTVTTKLDPGLDAEEARSDVRALGAWRPLPLDADLVASAWEVEDRYIFSFWDALVVAAARRAGCRRLLSEDLQAGQDLGELQVVDPFEVTPDEVL
jgi:predicted nucleic acid-binding protein